ncbi:hypothetical protein F5B20DRAFT_561598 [Whalleya microplaca]|nr:hypothetical protein F5B20DRAFT_561598 [Whalleya microplaca]
MIGTLVVCLPSKHDGGSIHLSHAGKKYVFDTGLGSGFDLTSLAWFADVTHEVQPLTSGYRLVLTYNIIHTGGLAMSAGLIGEQMNYLRSLITKWCASISDTEKLIYVLEHKYSETNLSLRNLKGRDQIVCQNLQELSSEEDFVILLASMDRTKAEEEGYYDDSEDSTELHRVITCDGCVVYNSMEVEVKEILGADPWDRDADSEDEGEFTGNAAVPATYRYHDTVVVIVPMHQLDNFVSGYGASLGAIVSLVQKKLDQQLSRPSNRLSALNFLKKAIKSGSLDGPVMCDVLTTAIKFHDSSLYRAVIRASKTAATQKCYNHPFLNIPATSYHVIYGRQEE